MKQFPKPIMATRGLRPSLEETRKYQTLYQNFIDLYPDSQDKLDAAGLPMEPIQWTQLLKNKSLIKIIKTETTTCEYYNHLSSG
jgi:hypothetical protein